MSTRYVGTSARMPVCSPDVLKVVVSLYHAVKSLIYTPPASQLTHTRIQRAYIISNPTPQLILNRWVEVRIQHRSLVGEAVQLAPSVAELDGVIRTDRCGTK